MNAMVGAPNVLKGMISNRKAGHSVDGVIILTEC